MANLTLAVPDDLLADMRSYAATHGTTVNAVMREHMEALTRRRDPDAWIAEVERIAQEQAAERTASTASAPRRRTLREEIYDDDPRFDWPRRQMPRQGG